MSDYLRFFILLTAGWINKDQQKIIDYLAEEILIYQELCKGHRFRFTDRQRRRLSAKAKALGRKHSSNSLQLLRRIRCCAGSAALQNLGITVDRNTVKRIRG
jgi:hypothetical protein